MEERQVPQRVMTNLPYAKKKVSENCIYHEATKDELHKVAVDFANSALRCKEAGVDGVQIHGAHGYFCLLYTSF